MTKRGLRAARRAMTGRDPGEPHRAATSLELLFDLCFVIAVAQASHGLGHAIAEGHHTTGVLRYAVVFFTVWWAWMNFTWLASAYDSDDVPYRLTVLLQIAGSLVLAAGVARAFADGDLLLITLGYLLLRTTLAALWLRVARSDPGHRRTALRFAGGVAVCQAGWVGLLFLPERAWPAGVVAMIIAETAVPVWAQAAGMTPWHPGHIAERYGLFLLIVLGESVAAAATAVREAFGQEHDSGALYALATGGLLTVFGMWWLYFARPARTLLAGTHRVNRRRFTWAYGHYLVFASAAAEGAGLAAYAQLLTGHGPAPTPAAGAAVTVPLAVFLITVWAVHIRPHRRGSAGEWGYPAVAAVLPGAAFLPAPALAAGLLSAALVVVVVVTDWVEPEHVGRGEGGPSAA
ncbi:low temperature requirement protein A [Streptomyces sp. 35G-GA-8]|uniref:low temperature requirement protein A n=1 Tax=Streptomyces sp. 35G-GA-8 TaxID=2939434 RepID=UPI00201F7860|nr:low temperature requirement protein A [Streptomyces sp. 35G-GA-8]MCL7376901.1 low temperature requirement protein A [Streptomyces sp. 35G-GA-8]